MQYHKPKALSKITISDFCYQYRNGEMIEPISYWVVRKQETDIIASLCENIEPAKEKRTLLDSGSGLGFIPYLFANTEGLGNVVGINLSEEIFCPPCRDPGIITDVLVSNRKAQMKSIVWQARPTYLEHYRHPNLLMETCDAETTAKKYKDKILCVTCVYMESGINLTPQIFEINPKIIVYVRDKHGLCGPLTQVDWERDKNRAFEQGERYRTILRWDAPSHYCLEPKLEGSYCAYEDINQNEVEIQLRRDVALPQIRFSNPEKYGWETLLDPVNIQWVSDETLTYPNTCGFKEAKDF